jgi:hypothetical protein
MSKNAVLKYAAYAAMLSVAATVTASDDPTLPPDGLPVPVEEAVGSDLPGLMDAALNGASAEDRLEATDELHRACADEAFPDSCLQTLETLAEDENVAIRNRANEALEDGLNYVSNNP